MHTSYVNKPIKVLTHRIRWGLPNTFSINTPRYLADCCRPTYVWSSRSPAWTDLPGVVTRQLSVSRVRHSSDRWILL